MSKATIYYLLNEQGRRESLRNGGDGKRIQIVTGPLPLEDLNYFNVDEKGKCTMTAGYILQHNKFLPVNIDFRVNKVRSTDKVIFSSVSKVVEFSTLKTFKELLTWRKELTKYLQERRQLLTRDWEKEIQYKITRQLKQDYPSLYLDTNCTAQIEAVYKKEKLGNEKLLCSLEKNFGTGSVFLCKLSEVPSNKNETGNIDTKRFLTEDFVIQIDNIYNTKYKAYALPNSL